MHKTWIVVADSARARVFARTGRWQPLEEVRDLTHPESRLHQGDLKTGGHEQQQEIASRSRHDSNWATTPSEKESLRFAQEIAAILQRGRSDGSFERLVLIAAPAFLGRLRDKLDPTTAQCVVQALDKNWARHSTEKIRELLEKHF